MLHASNVGPPHHREPRRRNSATPASPCGTYGWLADHARERLPRVPAAVTGPGQKWTNPGKRGDQYTRPGVVGGLPGRPSAIGGVAADRDSLGDGGFANPSRRRPRTAITAFGFLTALGVHQGRAGLRSSSKVIRRPGDLGRPGRKQSWSAGRVGRTCRSPSRWLLP